jgi:hypothetical protein
MKDAKILQNKLKLGGRLLDNPFSRPLAAQK